jgi:hypothetical protein
VPSVAPPPAIIDLLELELGLRGTRLCSNSELASTVPSSTSAAGLFLDCLIDIIKRGIVLQKPAT